MKDVDALNQAYLKLTIAIVKQAARDYKEEYERYLQTGKKSKRFCEVENWLRHGDGMEFSFGKGEVIMEMIRKGVEVFEPDDEIEVYDNEQTDQ